MLSSFEQFTSKNAKILWGVLAVILIALPFVVKNQYFLTVVAKIGCYAILGLGLNTLTGYTGLVSLGHAGFVAIGAYTASLLAVTLGWSFFPAMLAGMLLGASYLYTRNLCFPISLHLFWNWIQGPILGYQVSGNNFTTSMLTLRMPEENVLNGGAFGFEGSLICTVLMIVFTILIVWWGEKREAISLAVPRSC